MGNKNKNAKVFAWVFGVLFVLTAGFMLLGGTTLLSVAPTGTALEFDGEFDSFALPQEVGGTELVINTTYAEASEAFTVAYETDADLNQTGTAKYQWGIGFEVSKDGMEKIDIDGDLATGIATTEVQILRAYLLNDEEGIAMESENAIAVANVETELDEFNFDLSQLADGEYVLVVEAKVLNGIAIADGEELMAITFEGESDDNDAVDEGTVTIYNSI